MMPPPGLLLSSLWPGLPMAAAQYGEQLNHNMGSSTTDVVGPPLVRGSLAQSDQRQSKDQNNIQKTVTDAGARTDFGGRPEVAAAPLGAASAAATSALCQYERQRHQHSWRDSGHTMKTAAQATFSPLLLG